MKITISSVSKLNPCADRFNNFKHHYPKFSGTLAEFVALKNISYGDKIWVATKILSRNQLIKWSILCAESVRHIYEKKYPNSKVLSELFDYLNSISNFDKLTEQQISNIKKLKYAAAYAAAYAADAAAYAAAYAADAAANAAAYAADAAANAAYAANAADAAAYAAEEQRNLNLLLLASLEDEEIT